VSLRASIDAAGRPLLATFAIVPRLEVVEALAGAGFDAVVLDAEHGPFSVGELPPLVAAAQGAGLTTIIRVADDRPQPIGAALDAGADGVLVPRIEGAADAAAAVAAARFPPAGRRGANPFVRGGRYGADPSFLAAEDARRACLVMVESRRAVDEIEAIAALPGLDGLFAGPFDLSAAYGVPGDVGHHDVEAAVERVVWAAARHGIVSAVFAPTPEIARRRVGQGFDLVALSVDARMMAEAFGATVAAVRK
jgi:4-hydroxy-2-oxoheptanedioate aldolase